MSRALISPPIGSQQPIGGPIPNNQPNDQVKLDVLDLLKRKFWFILFFMILGVALSLLYFFKVPKTFESTAKIFVDEKNAPSANSNDTETYESPVEKYVEVIKSAKILNPAIDEGGFATFETFEQVDDILFHLREEDSFDVIPADAKAASGVIKLAVRGATEKECQEILGEIVNSFDEYIKSTTKNLGGETTQLVERMQEQLSGRLQVVNEDIQLLVARPDLLNVDGHWVNRFHTQQIQMQDDLHQLMRERTRLNAQVKKVKNSQKLGKDQSALIVDILNDVNDKTMGSYVAINTQFVELKVKEQQMLNQFGNQHPDLISLRKQIEMLDDMRKKELSTLQRGGAGEIDESGQPGDVVEIFLELMNSRIEMLALEEKSLDDELIIAQTKSQKLSADVEKLKSRQREREQLESGYAAIVERLSEIKAYETHLWRNMTLLDPPSIGEQVAPSLPISLAGGLLLGCLVGFLFAGLKELAEKTFRSSEDISAILGARVIGHVHQFQRLRTRKDPNFTNVSPEVVALHQPASPSSESYRSIRTSLFFKAQETGAKVIQITSPTPGDGKSTTISNLAASIAQSGRRVLLIDADLRKPVQHKLFGLSNAVGLSSVIAGELTAEEAMQIVQPEYLTVMACGPVPGNPAELLTSNRFSSLINECRDDFDFILIDSPPMLAVTDPSIICTHVDLVYMVMRIRNGVRTNSAQAKEIIDSMGIDLGGVIVNGLRRRDHKSYQYSGQYGYGRYGKYKYGNPGAVIPQNEFVTAPPQGSETGV